MEYSGAGGNLIHEKNQKQKISWHCPFKEKNLKKATKKEKEYFLYHISTLVNFESKGIKRATL